MSTHPPTDGQTVERLRAVVRKYWRYDSFRPLQPEAMTAAVDRRDSLVVLPTGGGKSLCYQAPALLSDGPTVVVSPLISLMKDQVDALLQHDVSAAFLNSSLEVTDRRIVADGIRTGRFKLIFVSPERFADNAFLDMLDLSNVSAFAIDEAHCISHWGHDFRGDYRRLGLLKQRFGGAAVHGFTATATPRVRDDIVSQLGLVDPVVLVGDFFRPNLRYEVHRRGSGFDDVIEAVQARSDKAGIVYCIRRADVDELSARLRVEGTRAIGYHAGMRDDERTQAQDAFSAGRADLVVATVAFGMGIDRADIRYVIHAAMPKSIEHYQQETGRAGRDGEPAECILFYSGGDYGLWQRLIDNNEGTDAADQVRRLSEMYSLCVGASCRHRKLVTYFGQAWERDNCGACDICGGSLSTVPEATVYAQKILSCVARTGQRFGGGYVTDVLLGKLTDRIVERGDDQLSTFGLVVEHPKATLMAWVDQLADQGMLERVGEYNVLGITAKGWQVLRSQAEAKLYEVGRPRRKSKKRTRKTRSGQSRKSRGSKRKQTTPSPNGTVGAAGEVDHAGVDDAGVGSTSAVEPEKFDPEAVVLFGKLRDLRKTIATEMGVPAYMVFGDKTLRAMSRDRPTSLDAFSDVHGVGPAKRKKFGGTFVDAIRSHMGMSDQGSADKSGEELRYDDADSQE